MHSHRLSRLHTSLSAAQLDMLALTPGPSLTYFSGIHSHLSERPILLFLTGRADDSAVIIPVLEAIKAEQAGIAADRIFAWRDEDGYQTAFAQAAQTLNLDQQRLGIEALSMRVLEYQQLAQAAPGLIRRYADDLVAALRLRKEADEIAVMRHAVAVAEKALEMLLPRIQIGQTERQIAAMLLQALIEAGADGPAFEAIVSAGPNGASPHAVPTDRPIQAGDLLILDWGARVGDYVSDITRTFAVGEITPELAHIYRVVQAANAQGVAAARPGMSGETLDQAAREVIEDAGFGRYFIHRTGHGLGMEPHEPPSLMAGSRAPLPIGAVFTVEPGIYWPGRGGVRIEDDVVISAEGYECLTTLPRELRYVG